MEYFAISSKFLIFLPLGLLLHSRLLEISDSLSSAEVKKIKFLLKSKVIGFRLASITEAFELFEELETNGIFPLDYIGQLLGGIQRYDLVEKLGINAPLSRSRKGQRKFIKVKTMIILKSLFLSQGTVELKELEGTGLYCRLT